MAILYSKKEVAVAKSKRLSGRNAWYRRHAHWVLLAPALIYLGLIMGYPLFRGLQLSLTETSTLNPGANTYVGLKNYDKVLHSSGFFNSLAVTLRYASASVIGALLLGLGAALLMNRSMRGKIFVRTMVTLPWAAPPIAVALIFTWMFNPQFGIINAALHKLGIIGKEQHWLDNPSLALPTLVAITIWMTFPLTSLILLAALQSVPRDLYDAAKVDGATSFRLFRHVTIPLIRPTVYVMTLLLSIWALRRFDVIWVLTQGGPVDKTSTLVVQLYRDSFVYGNLGYGAAIGTLGFVLSVACTAIYFFANRRLERNG